MNTFFKWVTNFFNNDISIEKEEIKSIKEEEDLLLKHLSKRVDDLHDKLDQVLIKECKATCKTF